MWWTADLHRLELQDLGSEEIVLQLEGGWTGVFAPKLPLSALLWRSIYDYLCPPTCFRLRYSWMPDWEFEHLRRWALSRPFDRRPVRLHGAGKGIGTLLGTARRLRRALLAAEILQAFLGDLDTDAEVFKPQEAVQGQPIRA